MKNLIRKLTWYFSFIVGIWKTKLEYVNQEETPSNDVINLDYVTIFESLSDLNLEKDWTQKVIADRTSYTILCKYKQMKSDNNIMAINPTTDPETLRSYVEKLGIEIKTDQFNLEYKCDKVTKTPCGVSLWSLDIDVNNKRRLELLNIIINYPY